MVIYWAATFNSFRGQKMANKLSTLGGLWGTIIPDAHFYPFDWQIEGRKPWEVSKWPAGYQPTEQQVDDAETEAISRHATEPHI